MQGAQPVALLCCWKVPAAHGAQSGLRASWAKLPGEHALGAAAPPGHEKPAAQSKQSGLPSASLTLPNVPGAHDAGSSRLAPTGQKRPGAHLTQPVAPVRFWKEPAAQSVHAEARWPAE